MYCRTDMQACHHIFKKKRSITVENHFARAIWRRYSKAHVARNGKGRQAQVIISLKEKRMQWINVVIRERTTRLDLNSFSPTPPSCTLTARSWAGLAMHTPLCALPLASQLSFVTWWDVLVSAGIELILFLVAGTVLCFGFSVRIMLIIHWCFSCC